MGAEAAGADGRVRATGRFEVPPLLADADRSVVVRAQGLARGFVEEVRPLLLRRAGNADPDMKGDGSPVTAIDVEVNERLAAAVASAFPDHAMLSEELDTHHGATEWTWIVDPIDGTSNFTSGLPYWCVSIALTRQGRPVYGLVDAPPIDACYESVRGEGATRNGAAIHVRERVDFDDPRSAHVPLLLATAMARRGAPRLRLNPRVMGAAALDLCLVAEGTAAAAISTKPKVWDHAAGGLIVEEAGGSYVTLSGEPLLPLREDTEYEGRSAAAAAGPDADYLDALLARFRAADVH